VIEALEAKLAALESAGHHLWFRDWPDGRSVSSSRNDDEQKDAPKMSRTNDFAAAKRRLPSDEFRTFFGMIIGKIPPFPIPTGNAYQQIRQQGW
jgi:hypothetical protein